MCFLSQPPGGIVIGRVVGSLSNLLVLSWHSLWFLK